MPLKAWNAFLKLYKVCFVSVKQSSQRFSANLLRYVYYAASLA